MPAHPTFYVRRAVVEAIGPFDLAYPTAADYDWMLRALDLHDFRSRHLPRIMVDMMVGGRSTSGIRSSIVHNLEALRSRRRRLGAGPIDRALFAKPLRKLSQFAKV
jgi:glycosyltransferase